MSLIKFEFPATGISVQVPSGAPYNHQISGLTIRNVVDNPIYKRVDVYFFELPNFINIWDGDEYDNIGQWTDEQLSSNISGMINNNLDGILDSGTNFNMASARELSSKLSERVSKYFSGFSYLPVSVNMIAKQKFQENTQLRTANGELVT
jgi:hypothetical protein